MCAVSDKRHDRGEPSEKDAAPESVTRLLSEWSAGDRDALNRLIPIVYGELRRIAAGHLVHERTGHTLQPTALVHEVYLKLKDRRGIQWRDRGHFYAIAARSMRQILVDNARRKHAAKRQVSEVIETESSEMSRVDLLALDAALDRLAALDPSQIRIVELRFFAGLSIADTATVLEISPATVKREWDLAKAWLLREIERGAAKASNT
ncbi:MAG TPA: ECF-type sigma factor [Terriglobia bacterium]|nr:ECF-type sigma factor [Terriglobia bacterium]